MIAPLSIIICTYNRESVLLDCLECFSLQSDMSFELIIVDNASTDSSPQIIEKFAEGKEWVKCVVCEEVGLSVARNCGAEKSDSAWIGYVDDDALVGVDFVAKVLAEIEKADFQAFGGVYTPWYKYGRPCWYSDTYGGNRYLFESDGRRELKLGEYFSGGIAFYRKELITDGSGFPVDFGMKGELTGYGEENMMQDEIRSQGYTLGVVPEISMRHLVAEYKLDIMWHLNAQLESGRSYTRQHGASNLLAAFIKFLIFPLFRLRSVVDSGFTSVRSLGFGSFVLVIRGYAYYWGKLDLGAKVSK